MSRKPIFALVKIDNLFYFRCYSDSYLRYYSNQGYKTFALGFFMEIRSIFESMTNVQFIQIDIEKWLTKKK